MNKDLEKKKVLYLSYDGIMEPLGQSQVLSYLENLSGVTPDSNTVFNAPSVQTI